MPALDRRWTAADVRALTREDRAWPRYELIDGELLVTPSARLAHQLAAFELCRVLDEYLATNPVGLALMSPADLELSPGTITQPDVFVVPAQTEARADRLEWSDVRTLLLAIGLFRTNRPEDRASGAVGSAAHPGPADECFAASARASR